MTRTIEIDDRFFAQLEDCAKFCGTFDTHFHTGWEDEIESLDDLWEWANKAFYGDAVKTNKKLKPQDKLIFVDPTFAITFLFAQLDYRGVGAGSV